MFKEFNNYVDFATWKNSYNQFIILLYSNANMDWLIFQLNIIFNSYINFKDYGEEQEYEEMCQSLINTVNNLLEQSKPKLSI